MSSYSASSTSSLARRPSRPSSSQALLNNVLVDTLIENRRRDMHQKAGATRHLQRLDPESLGQVHLMSEWLNSEEGIQARRDNADEKDQPDHTPQQDDVEPYHVFRERRLRELYVVFPMNMMIRF